MIVDKVSGFAPIQTAMGPCLVFRSDFKPITIVEIEALH